MTPGDISLYALRYVFGRLQREEIIVGFEVLTTVTLESSVFWDITPLIPFVVNQRFRRKLRSTFNRLHDVIFQKMDIFKKTVS